MGKFSAFSAREFLPFFGLGDSFDRRGCVDFQAFAWGSAYSFRLQGFSGLGSWNFRAENTDNSLFLFKYKSNLKYLMIWFSKFGLNISLIIYNPGDDIFKLCNILVQARFPASKTKLDVQYNKLGMRVSSRNAERLKIQELRRLGNISGVRGVSPRPRNSSVAIAVKSRYQSFVRLSNFTEFLYLLQFFVQICSLINCCHYYFFNETFVVCYLTYNFAVRFIAQK